MGAMREILFRGKRVEDGKWIYGYLSFFYIDNPKKGCMYSPKEVRRFDVMSETVGQYTGLTDKNGTKIFEGDILHVAQGDFVVRWSESICSFVAGEKEKIRPCMNSGTMKHCEVIGNIYDNPKLLETDIHTTKTTESE